jgi:acetylornithine/succinyldiaminopimelate/putrescine aminotransferase
MKKLLFLSLICSVIISTTVKAQAGDPVSMLQQIKDRVKQPMVENTGLTDAQADKLIELKEKHPIIRDVRGMGMMLALESRFDVRDILMDGIKNGLLMLYSGRTVIRLLPPLVMKKEQVSRAVEIMDDILNEEEKRRNVQR